MAWRSLLGLALLTSAACGTTVAPSGAGATADVTSADGSAGQGPGAVNIATCDRHGGFRSAVRVAIGVTDPALRAQLAAALADAGYTLPGAVPQADAGSTDAPQDDATNGEPSDAEPGDASDPAEPDAPPADAEGGEADAQGGEADAEADAAEPPAPPSPTEPPLAVDLRRDAIFLRPDGQLIVASYCPLDRLEQMRRLDYGLAAVVRAWSALEPGGDYKLETQRWARPDGIYADQPDLYWRQYIDADLRHPLIGTVSLVRKPLALAFGLFGHADTPSTVGDVVRVQSFEVAGIALQTAHTWQITDVAALLWDATAAAQAGDLPFTMDLLVADAGVLSHVGVYHAFFEALFAPPTAGSPGTETPGLGVAVQGSLPGAIRVARPIQELGLPLAPTHE